MYKTKDQYEVLQQIRCKEDETKRIDCPFCGGKYTLTVSKVDGSLVWNCYKASCEARGGRRTGYSRDAIIEGSYKTKSVRSGRRTRPLPKILSNPCLKVDIVNYIEQFGILDVVQQYPHRFKYDPAENRILFMMEDCEGAVGRSPDRTRKPKWLAYGDVSGIYTIGTGPTAVVVEDAISACAVSRIPQYTGVALLGTNLSHVQKRQLRAYKRLIICLDRDASKKSLLIAQKLRGPVTEVTVRFLKDDLKYLDETQIKELMS